MYLAHRRRVELLFLCCCVSSPLHGQEQPAGAHHLALPGSHSHALRWQSPMAVWELRQLEEDRSLSGALSVWPAR